jgi:hypothetical protein
MVAATKTDVRLKVQLEIKTFNQISEINWKDKNTLEKMGFSNYDDYYIAHYDSDEYMCSIIVQKNKDIPKNVKYKNGIGYKIYEEGSGIFSFNHLFGSDNSVIRRYFLYLDGVTIRVTEDNIKSKSPVFTEFIKKISNIT